MDSLLRTYVMAFEKKASFGSLLKSLPFWIGGGLIAEKIFAKKPEVRRIMVPRALYQKMLQQRKGAPRF